MSSAEQIVAGTPAKAETPKPSARINVALENAIFGLLLLLALAVPFWTKAAVLLARIALVLWLAKIAVTRRTRLAKFPLTWPLLAFLAAAAISSAFSYEPVMSWNRMRGVAMLLLVFIVADSLRTLKQVRWIVFGLLFSTVAVAANTCLQFAFSSAHPARAQGFFSLYIPYSEFLMLMAALNFGLLSAALHARRRQHAWPLLVALTFILVALLLTETRAAFASLLLGVTLVAWWEGKRTTRILSLVALAAAVGLGSLWFHHARANQGWFQHDDPGTQYRVLMWEDGIRLARQHPWTGVGMDSIYRHWQEFGLRAYEKYPWLRSHFHSSYVQIAVECGLPALAAWLWLMGAYLVFLFRLANRREETSDWFCRGLAMGLLASMITFLAVATVHYVIGDPEVMVLFWLMMGVAISLDHVSQPKDVDMASLTTDTIKQKMLSHSGWYHQIELAPGVITPGINDSQHVLDLLQLPADCKGMRALDIGAMDGFFSFALEKRGADVLAIDNMPPHRNGFSLAAGILGSKVAHKVANVYELNPETYGKFDIVLFLGVLYHLRNPLLALDKIRTVCQGRLWVESQVIDEAYVAKDGEWKALRDLAPQIASDRIMQFYPRAELGKDFSNWWAPNLACLRAMLQSAGFVADRELLNGARGILECHAGEDPETEFYRQAESSLILDEAALDKYTGLLKSWPKPKQES